MSKLLSAQEMIENVNDFIVNSYNPTSEARQRELAASVAQASATLALAQAVVEQNAILRSNRCTSDDPRNHQGDTCPVHEV